MCSRPQDSRPGPGCLIPAESCYHLSGSFIPLDMPEQKRTDSSVGFCIDVKIFRSHTHENVQNRAAEHFGPSSRASRCLGSSIHLLQKLSYACSSLHVQPEVVNDTALRRIHLRAQRHVILKPHGLHSRDFRSFALHGGSGRQKLHSEHQSVKARDNSRREGFKQV